MFQMSQCVTAPLALLAGIAGSGSFMMIAKLCVPGGTCVQLSAGLGAGCVAAAPVYLSGITPPSSQAVDVMMSGGVWGAPPARPCPPPAGGPCARSARLIAAVNAVVAKTFVFIGQSLRCRP